MSNDLNNPMSFFTNSNPELPSLERTSKNSVEFRPSPKKAPGGVFKAIIRFVANPNEPNKNIVTKFTTFLEHPLNHQKREIDCPYSVGKPDPISATYFMLNKSENAVLKENAKKFNSSRRFASIIQVISCESDPSLVNKFLIWRYGVKIHQKIDAEQNPPIGNPHNPFAVIDGRAMQVVIKEVGGFNNYDQCMFFDADPKQVALRMVQTDAQGNPQIYAITKESVSSQEGAVMALNYLKENVPSVEPYEYHDWDAETETFVNECIKIYTNPNYSVQAASMSMAAQQPMQTQPMQTQPTMQQPAMQQAAPVAPQMGGMGMQMPTMGQTQVFNSNPSGAGFNASGVNSDVNSMINGTAQAQQTAPASSNNMSLDDILNGQMM